MLVMNVYAFEIGPDNFSPAGLFGDFGELASDIVLILTSVAAAASVILIVLAGIKFVTSGGDPKKLASASSTLTYAIIGLVVTALAFVILNLLQKFLGSSVQIT